MTLTHSNEYVYRLPEVLFSTLFKRSTPKRYNGKRAWKMRGKVAR